MTERASVRIATAQYPIDQPESLEAWQDKIARWVDEGAATGAELLVFPEYAAMEQAAMFGPKIAADLAASLEAVADAALTRVAFHADLAREHDVHILVGSGPMRAPDGRPHGRQGGRIFNAAHLVTPEGLIGVQEKIIMTPFERDWGVSAGGPVRVFETRLGRVGVAICYDSEFPLIVRAMAEAKAEILLVPSCTERMSGYHRVRTGAAARALENGIVAVTSPTVGDALWSPAVDRNVGAACILVPPEQGVSDTGVLEEGVLNAPGWITATVDLAALRRLRSSGEMRNFGDWAAQPGAGALPKVEVVSLIAE